MRIACSFYQFQNFFTVQLTIMIVLAFNSCNDNSSTVQDQTKEINEAQQTLDSKLNNSTNKIEDLFDANKAEFEKSGRRMDSNATSISTDSISLFDLMETRGKK